MIADYLRFDNEAKMMNRAVINIIVILPLIMLFGTVAVAQDSEVTVLNSGIFKSTSAIV
jgi:hypothetical protein